MTVISFGSNKDYKFLLIDTLVIDIIEDKGIKKLYVKSEENKIRILKDYELVYTLCGDKVVLEHLEKYLNNYSLDITNNDVRISIVEYLNNSISVEPKHNITFVFMNNDVIGDWDIYYDNDEGKYVTKKEWFSTYNEDFSHVIWFGRKISHNNQIDKLNSTEVVSFYFNEMCIIHNNLKNDDIPTYNLRGLEDSELCNNSYVILFKNNNQPIKSLYNNSNIKE